MTLTVAIIGRPNVGKSTLFNRLVGGRRAIVDDTPGVTRDWQEAEASIGPLHFTAIDTAGLEEAAAGTLERRMRESTEAVLRRADVALFLIDARTGVTPLDRHFADLLRRSGKPIVLVANKCEGKVASANLAEAYALGLGEPLALSAEHGEGLSDLYDALAGHAGAEAAVDAEDGDRAPQGPLKLAIVGRPNVGKSTLVNRLIGKERLLVGPEAGITRDAITVDWTWEGRAIRLVDTAGMRRKSRVEAKLEKLAVADTLSTIRLAEVVVLMLDGTLGLEKQDLTIADLVVQEGRALVIGVNKWDLVEDRAKALRAIEDRLEAGLAQVRGVPVVTFSAATGRHVDRLMPAVAAQVERWNRRVRTSELNRWLEGALERHPPPAVRGRRLKLRYATQVSARPPTVALFCSRPMSLPEDYIRYLANGFRESFDLAGVPIRFVVRKPDNPYQDNE
ncbi:ribosome biogenesis GTPase Der [Desertibaculum subflavum]|uniref:ribosome biogenesis GTPase Der n=1 Tax=Desertibaculum subflavum TaxID=2268458 RepID=UPI000E6759EB